MQLAGTSVRDGAQEARLLFASPVCSLSGSTVFEKSRLSFRSRVRRR